MKIKINRMKNKINFRFISIVYFLLVSCTNIEIKRKENYIDLGNDKIKLFQTMDEIKNYVNKNKLKMIYDTIDWKWFVYDREQNVSFSFSVDSNSFFNGVRYIEFFRDDCFEKYCVGDDFILSDSSKISLDHETERMLYKIHSRDTLMKNSKISIIIYFDIGMYDEKNTKRKINSIQYWLFY